MLDTDSSNYCDEIPRASLPSRAARSVSDGWPLGRTKAWLETAAEEDYGHGGNCRRNWGRRERGCMLQVAPTTHSQSHIYMRHYIGSRNTLGCAQCCGERHLRGRLHGLRPGPGGSYSGDSRSDRGLPAVVGMACEVRCVR